MLDVRKEVVKSIEGKGRTLEEQPLLSMPVLIATWRKADIQILIVLLNQVLDDGAALPQCNTGIEVMDGRHATVGVDGQIVGLLEVWEGYGNYFVGDGELFAEYCDFGWVGATFAVHFDGLEGRHNGLRVCRNWACGLGDG
jgi:hypothetical protein